MLIDDADLGTVGRWSWTLSTGGYAMRGVYRSGRTSTSYMHRELMGAPKGVEVDHINGDRLDNRRSNLRLVSRSENMQNLRSARSDSKTGVRGVEPARNGRFRARIYRNSKPIEVGTYDTLSEADAAVRAARAKMMTHSPESTRA